MSEVIASTYELKKKLGQGGGGNVYLAEHLRLGKEVVLKVDKRELTTDPKVLRREVDILKELNHPYIPRVYDFFTEGESVITVMDYIKGESLDKPLKRGEVFSQAQVIKWAKQLLKALVYLHSDIHGNPPRGYVHSDIKPANIMRTPDNNVCLIDFNIALALGEESVVGRSAGYASPEHYGLDFSSLYGEDTIAVDNNETITAMDQTETMTVQESTASSDVRKITPDVRSDIYSLGATLYHLLSGRKPEKNALQVIPLSDKDFSPLLVKIITKAMNPNPELRYQTAQQMLDEFLNLHENDSRSKKLKKTEKILISVATVFAIVGLGLMFTGLKRMQNEERVLKNVEYSKQAIKEGDTALAISYGLKSLPKTSFFYMRNLPVAQSTLTSATGVYNLRDGFNQSEIYQLSKNLIDISISPNGENISYLYSGNIDIIDADTQIKITTLKSNKSALSEVEYIDDNTIAYAGESELKVYSISDNKELWKGEKATTISVSGNKKVIAALYRANNYANIYDTNTGKKINIIKFDGKSQKVIDNDIFANPHDNIFELNNDGTKLAVSYNDGSLSVFSLDSDDEIEVLDNSSGYTHFEGGFYNQYFAFSGTDYKNSEFSIIDLNNFEEIANAKGDSKYGVKTDNKGIYLQQDNTLVNINPDSGEQQTLVSGSENIYSFDVDDKHTIISTDTSIKIFDKEVKLLNEIENSDQKTQVKISNNSATFGSIDSSKVKILKYKEYPEQEIIKYQTDYDYDEARICADNKNVMMFDYKGFSIFNLEGKEIKRLEIENSEQVYDQQFIRKKDKSVLEITYNDGKVVSYDGNTGEKVDENIISEPDKSLKEIFYTDEYKIESPLHGAAKVYKKKSGKFVCELPEDGYLTYIYEAKEKIIAQYMTVEGYYYGILMDNECNEIAQLPYLCDVYQERLYFDYPNGYIRSSYIFDIEEIIKIAKQELEGGK